MAENNDLLENGIAKSVNRTIKVEFIDDWNERITRMRRVLILVIRLSLFSFY